ncbi:hypothetical protein P9139_17605 [Curtobacterium flaccumfaciens]|nr:hypothetical protein P9139_17605 [Curtobacterium flaccumfaciens]
MLTDPSRDRAQRSRFSDKVPARGRLVRTVLIDGIETTDLVTTAVDVALRCDRGHAIVVIDAVLGRAFPGGNSSPNSRRGPPSEAGGVRRHCSNSPTRGSSHRERA